MKWVIFPSTLDDAKFVYRNLWARGVEELTAFGITRALWLEVCKRMIASKSCFTFLGDGKVKAILGAEKEGETGYTWFQATDEAEQELPSLTRQLRRAIAQLAKETGLKIAVLSSLCISADAPRWFELLGFREDAFDGGLFAGMRERRFSRTWDHVRT